MDNQTLAQVKGFSYPYEGDLDIYMVAFCNRHYKTPLNPVQWTFPNTILTAKCRSKVTYCAADRLSSLSSWLDWLARYMASRSVCRMANSTHIVNNETHGNLSRLNLHE